MQWRYAHGRPHWSCSSVPCSLRLGVVGSSRGYLLGGRGCEESNTRGGQAMMRLGRTASPLVALYMLTSAATADADCAWVWEITASSAPKTTTEPVRAYAAKSECDGALAAALDSFTTAPGFVRKDTTYQE